MPSRSPKPGGSVAHRRVLVAELEKHGAITSKAVRNAFLAVSRERFVPEVAESAGLAKVYANEVHVVKKDGRGMAISSSSMPGIMASMLETLDVHPGMRVLEIGTGTGYNAALLSNLVGASGSVTSVELQSDLAEKAAAALREGGYPVRVVVSDARLGLYGEAPFDRIILTASTAALERAWIDQLVAGGLICLPLRLGSGGPWEQLVVTLRKEGDRLRSTSVVSGGFMWLRGPDAPEGQAPPPQISVGDFVDGRREIYADLAGEDLASMSGEARRELLRLLVSTPRVRTISLPEPATVGLIPYLAFGRLAGDGMVALRHLRAEFAGGGQMAVAVATRDGRSLAVLVGTRSERRVRLESYGGDEATVALRGMIGRWRRAGRPAMRDLTVTAGFGSRPSGAVAENGLRYMDRGDGWVAVGWPHIL